MAKQILVEHRTNDVIAYLAEAPKIWEVARTEAEAIGQLVLTYARCWPEQWPDLKVDCGPGDIPNARRRLREQHQ